MSSSTEILHAQTNAALKKNVFLGLNTDDILLIDRCDDCNFSGRGLEAYADAWFRILKSHLE